MLRLIFALVLFVVAASTSNTFQDPRGTFDQCNIQTNDLTTLDMTSGNNVAVTILGGGCVQLNDYELTASYSASYSNVVDTGSGFTADVSYSYSKAHVVPYTDEAVGAFQVTCSGLIFAVNITTDVLSCLYCNGNQYDIISINYNETVFYLGQNDNSSFACSTSTRPTIYETDAFYLRAQSAASALMPTIFVVAIIVVASIF